MTRLIHLNGLPSIGKSTLARRYAADHPGVLVCDIDVIRTMISDWQDSAEAAERSRIVGLAMATAYLGTGRDVVLPQLVADPGQLARFAGAADGAGAAYVHVMLTADPDVVARRLRDRASASDDEWTAFATAHWDAAGGDDALRAWAARLDDLPATRLASTELDPTYDALLALLVTG